MDFYDMEGYAMKKTLEKEIDAFMEQLPDMLKQHEGMWTVFKEGKPLGFYHAQEDALREAYKKYGNVPLLLREVSREYLEYGKYGKPVIIPSPIYSPPD